jgi:hypothetical protein
MPVFFLPISADIFVIPAALNWTIGDFRINPQLFVVVPTGKYQKGTLANTGKNHWMSDPVFGLSYFSHKTATEFHSDWRLCYLDTGSRYTLSQRRRLSSGGDSAAISAANGFYYQQVTGDTGPGAVIGPNERTDIGVGPVFTLIHNDDTSEAVNSTQNFEGALASP